MNARPTSPSSCQNPQDDALPFEEARDRILAAVRPLEAAERLPLRTALGRVLAHDVVSAIDVPPYTNSAMDGYALRAADLPSHTTQNISLRLAGQSLAGVGYRAEIAPGECVRITTGALLPPGADTVVIQEDVTVSEGRVTIGSGHRAGQNIRLAGEDLARGAVALPRGHRLNPADLGLLASLGCPEIDALRRPRVAFLSTGDELRGLGRPLGEGEIHDSNRYTLFGALTRLGVDVHDLGVVPDRPDALREAFSTAAATHDVVISTGGVSVGDADHTREVLATLGTIGFWRIAIRPGRPLAFGHIGDTLFFGLPGNPVAVMVTFYQLVQPALVRLSGATPNPRRQLRARALEPMRKRRGRTEFLRGQIETGGDGEIGVHLTGAQGSGVLRSMSLADCFVILDNDRGPVDTGEWVMVEPFCDFV
ncbi:molybdopterin molybdenumtransferase MoeA [Acidihalobacter yilgarnensis]|uniref:Molybdopterin molybdenumtransferase n=1 Tax=Acidihalobacter yilgarnensis TaxID=2819280 RepID=A0A1D8ILH0_9GAMM|nr:gephyrin-like molybdotransferase Glp [Acidihalobacter yilgarnensis]AOU97298.1 molybdopterin molybdenumtransferase MoeA [Acidihalobacter yilgarnensis]